MIIESVQVSNYRSILSETLQCENVTALVGPNGSGKSSFLYALDLFYNPSPKLEQNDFYNRESSEEIVVAVKFKNLSTEAEDLFAAYLQDHTLTVERVLTIKAGSLSSKYHGATLGNTEFQSVRNFLEVKDRGKTAKAAYDAMRARSEYSTLPAWTNLQQVSVNLKDWEGANPPKCVRQRDDGQFFGFGEVAQGYLGRFTKFLFIPAVREAAIDAAEGRSSVLTALMDLVVRSVLATKQELLSLKANTQQEYQKILDPDNLQELNTLANRVTETLQTFVPSASVQMKWLPLGELEIPLPKADVSLIEDGYASPVSRTGHGLQRAFILTMLQHLVLAQTISAPATASEQSPQERPAVAKLPNLVLAIEEPELYQHPSRQRHLTMILQKLASGATPGVAKNTQIIYATHSPLFVSASLVDQIRLLRKRSNGSDKPKICKITRTNLDKIAQAVWESNGGTGPQFTGSTLLPRLQAIMTPWMSEGFFSDVAVLVEGEDDRAAILGVAKSLGYDLESAGCSVIPCGGKMNLDRPATIFRQLGIPIYVIWDGDKGDKEAQATDNHRLLRLMGEATEDWPATRAARNFACFEGTLEHCMRDEIGHDIFDRLLQQCQAGLGFPKKKHALKNPVVIATILIDAHKEARSCVTLSAIVEQIIDLKKGA